MDNKYDISKILVYDLRVLAKSYPELLTLDDIE